MNLKLTNDWQDILANEFSKEYFHKIVNYLKEETINESIFPKEEDIFNALNLTPYNNVKVVILGQDPYHGPNQAHGLSFSVMPEIKIPPSLRNIYKELNEDIGCYIPNHGYLVKWARQGVLLLNASLTVRMGEASSHSKIGWEIFTDEVISRLNNREQPVVFILWGNYAKSKKKLITNSQHFVIESVHPSPLSARRGFFGSKPFSKANTFLEEYDLCKIDWQIENI